MRTLNRHPFATRDIHVTTDYLKNAASSVLIEFGNTKVLCGITVENEVPHWVNSGGWITAEYSMLPCATHTRTKREGRKGTISGRTQEIQRLIGRSLRAVADLSLINQKTFLIDCDVIQADGSTRCASITGATIAFQRLIRKMLKNNQLLVNPLRSMVAAVSVGLLNDEVIVDLDYQEDLNAQVDSNVIMTDKKELVEFQGTGEEHTFSRAQLNAMLDAAEQAIEKIIIIQQKYIEI